MKCEFQRIRHTPCAALFRRHTECAGYNARGTIGALTKQKASQSRTTVRFTKMHGIGNDYVYVDCFDEPPPPTRPSWPGGSPTGISASAATG